MFLFVIVGGGWKDDDDGGMDLFIVVVALLLHDPPPPMNAHTVPPPVIAAIVVPFPDRMVEFVLKSGLISCSGMSNHKDGSRGLIPLLPPVLLPSPPLVFEDELANVPKEI